MGSWCVFCHTVISDEKILNKEGIVTAGINYTCESSASQNLGE